MANDARDCDVQIQRLSQDEPEEAGNWLNQLRGTRDKVQKPLVAICEKMRDRDRLQRRITKLLERVRVRTKEEAKPHIKRFGDWARASLQPIVDRFFDAVPTDDADEKQLHFFRIQGKQLRYAMELLAPAFACDFRERLYPLIEELQDKLGHINDLAVSIARLKEHVDCSAAADENLSKLLSKENLRLEQARQAYRHWWMADLRQNLRPGFEAILEKASAAVHSIDHTSPVANQPQVNTSQVVTSSSNRSVSTLPSARSTMARPVALPKAGAAGKSPIVDKTPVFCGICTCPPKLISGQNLRKNDQSQPNGR
jgi:CHAD domain-containing protein